MSFQKYQKFYLEIKEFELKPSTYQSYKNITNKHLSYFSDYEIEKIKISDIRKFQLQLHKKNLNPKTVKNIFIVLIGIFQEAFYDEIIEKNPAEMVKLPKISKIEINPFTPIEINKILKNSIGQFQNFLAFAFFTGARLGEIIALQWININLTKKEIFITTTRRQKIETTTKTSTNRTIPIFDELIQYIENQKAITFEFNNYVFLNLKTKEPYYDHQSFIKNKWSKLLKDLKIKYKRAYNARHSFASILLSSGKFPPAQISNFLGHTDSQMLFKVYGKFIKSDVVDTSFNFLDLGVENENS